MNKVTLLVLLLSFSWSESGCTDPMAYNCEDDQDSTSYIIDVGGTKWDNSCSWSWDLTNSEYILENNGNNCNFQGVPEVNEDTDCLGYYNPLSTEDDGTCKYYQAPSETEIVFTIVAEDSIYIDWSLFQSPINATLESFHIQRCDEEFCQWIPGATPGNSLNQTHITDIYNWELDSYIKYAFFVKYAGYNWSNALDYTYLIPTAGCMDSNDQNYNPDANVDDESCFLNIDYQISENFKLNEIYPNPFNPNITINYSLNSFDNISIDIIDINGKLIIRLIDGNRSSGNYTINWDASNYPTGIYFIRYISNQYDLIQNKKILFLK